MTVFPLISAPAVSMRLTPVPTHFGLRCWYHAERRLSVLVACPGQLARSQRAARALTLLSLCKIIANLAV